MKVASVSDIRNELLTLPPKKLVELCQRLARFKKENKELLAFLLFEADNEPNYVESIKLEIEESFEQLNTANWYFAKKGLRKILRSISKYSKFTTQKESEVEMLLHFVKKMNERGFPILRMKAVTSLYEVQVAKVSKLVDLLHEDLRFDYRKELEALGV